MVHAKIWGCLTIQPVCTNCSIFIHYHTLMPYVSFWCQFIGTKKKIPTSRMSHIALCKLIIFPIALTCGRPDGRGDSGGHGGDAVIVLGVAGLDGSQVAVTPGSEATGQVQGLHGLGFHLTEHRLTHWFKLAIHFCFTHLWETKAISMLSPLLCKWGYLLIWRNKLFGCKTWHCVCCQFLLEWEQDINEKFVFIMSQKQLLYFLSVAWKSFCHISRWVDTLQAGCYCCSGSWFAWIQQHDVNSHDIKVILCCLRFVVDLMLTRTISVLCYRYEWCIL